MAGSSPHVAVGARVLVPVARPASLDSLLPIAAAMAREEPQTAARPEQGKIDEIASAPGIRRSRALAA